MQHWSQIAGNGCDSDIQRKQMPQSLDHQRVCISEINICKVLLEKKSQQICISNINSHLFFTVWPSNKIGSLTRWYLSHCRVVPPGAGGVSALTHKGWQHSCSRHLLYPEDGQVANALRARSVYRLERLLVFLAQASWWLQEGVRKQAVMLLR